MIFYTYVLLNPLSEGNFQYGRINFKYEPFYVGKGKNKRAESHIRFYKNPNTHKKKLTNLILEKNKRPIIIKFRENITEFSSLRFEKLLISIIGRRDKQNGPLLNLANGGSAGPTGVVRSKEQKLKISNSLKGHTLPDDHPFKIKGKTPWNKGKKGKPAWNKGTKLAKDIKDKISKSLTGRGLPDDHPFKQKGKSAWNKGLKTGKVAHNANPVIQLSMEGEYINRYPSLKAAIEDNPKCKTIRKVCIGKNKTSGGYKWIYEKYYR